MADVSQRDRTAPCLCLVLVGGAGLFGCVGEPDRSSLTESFPQPAVDSGSSVVPSFRFVARLGSRGGSDYLAAAPLGIVGDEFGRIFVTVATAAPPMVFDTTGEFLTRIGREGEGPGEFAWPGAMLIDPDGRLYIHDGDNSRITVVDSALDVVDTYTWGLASDEILYVGSRDFVAIDPNPRRRVSPTLHRVKDGELAASFGPLGASSIERRMALSKARDSLVWVAGRYQHSIQLWSENGSFIDSLQGPPEWFLAEPPGEVPGVAAPRARIQDLWEDDEGRLWVASWAPRRDWTTAWEESAVRVRRGEIESGPIPRDQLFRTVIEIYDAESERRVSRIQWDRLVEAFLPPDMIATRYEDEVGVLFVDLWRIEFP